MDSVISLFRIFSNNTKIGHRSYSHFWQWISGILSITLVTAIWGYSNVVIRQGEAAISPSVLLWMRFGVAGIVMLPAVVRIRLSLQNWFLGLGTGVLLGIAVLAMGWSMMTISVDEVAFIAALYVIFTPLGMSLIQRKTPSKLVWAAVGLSLIGLTLLIGKLTFNLHIGVLWALIAAIGISGQIIGTTSLSNIVTSVQLSGLQSVGAGIAMTLAVVIQGVFRPSIYDGIFHWTLTEWLWIGYLAIFATVIAVFLQAWGQARISATEAALAFNMEPVWTAVFALVVLSQGMTVVQVIGAVLIVSSLTLVKVPKRQ
ncbi:MAG: DMT family transporter [Bacilli bacterium]